MNKKNTQQKRIKCFFGALIILLIFLLQGFNVNAVEDQQAPEWQNQGQSTSIIRANESIELFAEVRDDVSVLDSYLSTNETGLWQNISGKYNSPLLVQSEANQWVWTNFTWDNPEISEGTYVGWKIFYSDTSGNQISTDEMSFLINSAPIVSEITGPNQGYKNITYTFSFGPTIDPDDHDVSIQIDWGDNEISPWTELFASATILDFDHRWETEGIYHIKVRAKDRYDSISEWSSAFLIEIKTYELPLLEIAAPSSALEGSEFLVTITVDNIPVEGVEIEFSKDTYVTDANGQAHINAPTVSRMTVYYLIARHQHYATGVTTISITNIAEQPKPVSWVYGVVTDQYGMPIEAAQVCIQASGVTERTLCEFSDDQGRYYIQILPGTYMMTVTKSGYLQNEQENISMNNNEAREYDFILQRSEEEHPAPYLQTNIDIIEAAIDAGIKGDLVTGEIDFTKVAETYSLILYKDQLYVENITITDDKISFSIGAEDLNSTIIALRIHTDEKTPEIQVLYDDQSLDKVGFAEIFSATGDTAKYTSIIINTTDGSTIYCFIYIPSFSEHLISILTLGEIITGISRTLGFLVYFAAGLSVIIIVLLPMLLYTLRFGKIGKKKK